MSKSVNDEVEDFEPFILAIFCNWCTYTGADQAGTSRMQRPANLRIMRVMCSGRVESRLIIFEVSFFILILPLGAPRSSSVLL